MPTTRRGASEAADDTTGQPRPRWQEGVLGFIYTFTKDKESFTNFMRFISHPVVVVVVFSTGALVVSVVFHQPVRVRWIAVFSTGGATALQFALRVLVRSVARRLAARRGSSRTLPGRGDQRASDRHSASAATGTRSRRVRSDAAAKPSAAEAAKAHTDAST